MTRTLSLINHLVGVFDDHRAAVRAARDLARLGIPDADIHLLRGEEGAEAFDSDGHSGRWTRLSRLSRSFTSDQSSDHPVGDAAIRDGRTVVAVHLRDREGKEAAVGPMTHAGGHLLDCYGRLQTEETSRWRGPELVLPPFLPR